jgi:peptide/nickel transport system permease protein
MSMLKRLLFLLVRAVPTVFVVVTLGFFLMKLAPGDIADYIAASSGAATVESTNALRDSFGLNLPVLEQLFAYYRTLAGLSLGTSMRFDIPVTELIADRLPATLLLVATSIVIALAIGIAAGTVMALNARKAKDRVISGLTLVFYSVPSFWVGLMLIIVFSVQLGWLPTGGAQTIGSRASGLSFLFERARYLLLPALSLALYYVAIYARLTRSTVIEMRRQDYVRTAVAKGLTHRQVTLRHVLRNALIPVTTLAGVHIAGILGGAVVIETVFSWPGMGRLTYEAINARDYVLLLGILLVSALVVIAANILVDLLHRVLDPRIKARS